MLRSLVLIICALACAESCSAQVRSYRASSRRPTYNRSYSVPRYSPRSGYGNSGYGSSRNSAYGSFSVTGRTPLSQQLASIASQTRRRKMPYRLDAGDMLAVIVEGVLSFKDAPIHLPKPGSATLPGMGYPIPVLEDGTIAMPIVRSISVRGLTVEEARKRVASTYYTKNIVKPSEVVTLSLLRKRTVDVTVVHSKPNSTARDVSIVKLTPDESHVLGALGQIGSFDTDSDIKVYKSAGQQVGTATRLADGDVVDMQAPTPGYFYTGGLLPGGQFELPRNRNLSLVQAIAIAGGSVGGGRLASFPPSDLVVIRAGRPAFTLDVNAALRNPNGFAVRPGDTLMLRYKNAEIIGNIAATAALGSARFFLP